MSEESTQNLPQDGVSQILARLDSIDSRLGNVEGRLSALEDKVDRRLQETRPIWEQVLTRLTAVEERLTKVEERLTKVEDEFFWFGRNFRNWTRELMKLQEKYEDLEERVEQTGSEPPK